jgi:hypothetical protein
MDIRKVRVFFKKLTMRTIFESMVVTSRLSVADIDLYCYAASNRGPILNVCCIR